MSDILDKRLNMILSTITSDDFLRAAGLGNELAFHIFDYPPEHELRVRKHIHWLITQIPMKRPGVRVVHVNLFDFLVNHLRGRGLLDRCFAKQREEGDEELRKALIGPLNEHRMADAFVAEVSPNECDLLLVSGVGSAYPLLRAHSLLNNLHPKIGQTPLVMFYPGRYDGLSLRLFGKSALSQEGERGTSGSQAPYYRAFRLIPEETKHES